MGKGIEELTPSSEQTIETIDVLQIKAAYKWWRFLLLLAHLATHRNGCGLAFLNEFQHVLRQTVEHLVESHHKGILVAVAESSQTCNCLEECLATGVVPYLADVRMLRIKGHKPVAELVEERKAFHL